MASQQQADNTKDLFRSLYPSPFPSLSAGVIRENLAGKQFLPHQTDVVMTDRRVNKECSNEREKQCAESCYREYVQRAE